MSLHKIRKTPGNTEWFMHDRFGMFIHFGLYSLPARHEWIKANEQLSDEKYQKYFDNFNPDLFDAREWARYAKKAGMKYVILTTKHHEGFCLFDSKYTDYKITNTKFGRDLVKEYVDALREEGLHVGFYYSLIDWHHPEFPIDVFHPFRYFPNAEELDKGRDMTKYAEFMRNQVTELLTNYGKIDIMWFDFQYPYTANGGAKKPWMQHEGGKLKEQWESEKLIETVRKLQPEIIINNRSGLEQDLWTPEQYQPNKWPRHSETNELVPWEVCQTFSGSWGYHRDEMTWKTPKMLIDMLVNTVASGGNLIMNVGPTSRGEFDYRAVEALEAYSNWMRYNSRSIYGCTQAEECFKAPSGVKLTESDDGKRLYIHLQEYPFKRFNIDGLEGKISYAQFLHDGSEILYKDKITENFGGYSSLVIEGSVFFDIPPVPPKIISPVIEVILK